MGEIQQQIDELKELSKMGMLPETTRQEILMAIKLAESVQEYDAKKKGQIEKEKIQIKYINKSDNKNPVYAKEGDSGFDLRANESGSLKPLERKLVGTGLYFELPDGYEMQIRPRSGLAYKNGITVLNTPGTVDCFSGEMKVKTVDGDKSINQLNINDIVYSFNIETFEIEKDTISKIHNTGIQNVLRIETENGVLEVTENTEIYTNNGWKLAINLTHEDEIIIF
jgi:deoxyuridine 5'-triphosphate nucleotidohydrolase